jgi:hypothetical protein
VEEAEIRSSTLQDPGFEAAILAIVRTFVFPSPAGSRIRMSYPLLFEADPPDPEKP